MGEFRKIEDGSGRVGLEWAGPDDVLRVEPWGRDGIRVRAGRAGVRDNLPGALLDRPESSSGPADQADVVVEPDGNGRSVGAVVNGDLRAEVSTAGIVRFVRADSGRELLAEEPAHFWWPGPRLYISGGNGHARLEQRFAAYDGEQVFGLGQHQHGRLDQKGTVIDLVQRNAEVTIPFLYSSRGYGLLWNNPAVGRVELAENGTRWVADGARQIDYLVVCGDRPVDVLARYAEATGHAPMLPDWAAGFWQCKLRYRTSEELLAVAREYAERKLPLSVIVADFFHWTQLGDWRFDPAEWPDPAAAVRELDELGVRLMVSVWPSVSQMSENYRPMLDSGLLISTEQGPPVHADWPAKGIDAHIGVSFYDATNPQAREFVWDRVRENYYDLGIATWWLDACEPELKPGHAGNLLFHAGPGSEVANLYPRENARAFYEGMRSVGEDEIVTLNRSAWAGSQRYGAALWSGDIAATFESLADQVRAGLNVAMSGIPWWTTDIGGFHGGDPDSEYFRELIVRWFQYGVFCPLFRLHGNRAPNMAFSPTMTGGPNEVWSFGDDAYAVIRELLFLRERLRPYILDQMRVAHRDGTPPMRPLFVDFPDDPYAWRVDDQFMFGPDILVAPVLTHGARSRRVYLPAGSTWTPVRVGEPIAPGSVLDGGQTIDADAPLENIPIFVRSEAHEVIRKVTTTDN